MITKRYLPDGTTRAVWADACGARERGHGGTPRRASRIEVIPSGPGEGLFHVDFSLLADATGDDNFRLCLIEKFTNYADANAAEVAWLTANYVLEGTTCVTSRRATTTSG